MGDLITLRRFCRQVLQQCPERVGRALKRRTRPGEPHESIVEVLEPGGHLFRRVALRVHGNEHRRDPGAVSGPIEFGHHPGEFRHLDGTDVHATGEAEEHHQVAPAQVVLGDLLAGLIRQAELDAGVVFVTPYGDGECGGDHPENDEEQNRRFRRW